LLRCGPARSSQRPSAGSRSSPGLLLQGSNQL
jgi:hypothetical protein